MSRTYTIGPDVTLFHADCREALKALPDNCIDAVPTDPPYALVSIQKRYKNGDARTSASLEAFGSQGVSPYMRAAAGFMGKSWDTGETAMSAEFWAEVYRVLKPGGFVAAFGSSRGYHRMACAIEDAGFEIRDSLMWIYGTGFPKSHDVSKGIDKAAGAEREVLGQKQFGEGALGAQRRFDTGYRPQLQTNSVQDMTAPATPQAAEWEGWGTALKPAFEPIVLARKPLSEGTVAANVLKWRTGALNIDGCRVEAPDGVPKFNQKGQSAAGVYGDGLNGSKRTGEMDTTTGRWPANVVTDGSDEVVGMFPTTASGTKRGGQYERESGVHDGGQRTDGTACYADSGSAARFFYSAKASKADRAGSKHPTVKPISLMAWLARLICPPGGVVLDPFAGTGTTGAAAVAEGFKCVLVERESEYVADILRRFGISC